jgi:hypothetical protein
MLPDVVHIDHYVRRGTWLSPTFGRETLEARGADLDNCMTFSWCESLLHFLDMFLTADICFSGILPQGDRKIQDRSWSISEI